MYLTCRRRGVRRFRAPELRTLLLRTAAFRAVRRERRLRGLKRRERGVRRGLERYELRERDVRLRDLERLRRGELALELYDVLTETETVLDDPEREARRNSALLLRPNLRVTGRERVSDRSISGDDVSRSRVRLPPARFLNPGLRERRRLLDLAPQLRLDQKPRHISSYSNKVRTTQ